MLLEGGSVFFNALLKLYYIHTDKVRSNTKPLECGCCCSLNGTEGAAPHSGQNYILFTSGKGAFTPHVTLESNLLLT